ncbi:hypothetical protein R5R35_008932 [Gryllus longicercus]|uniref:Axonemal 84 kDa protein n=1 Tax=Gryllus longicercus TaxID=2509291 RepID=A0AAN9Z446_9ORTH
MPPKKKLSKREKALLAAEQAEKKRIEAERERHRLIQEEKDRIERDLLEIETKAKQDTEEQALRIEQLKISVNMFRHHTESMTHMELDNRLSEEWNVYLKCDGLPDPASLSEMNTYLYLWQLNDNHDDFQEVIRKTDEVLKLLSVLEELIDFPLEENEVKVKSWKELRNTFRVKLLQHMDAATYCLLKDVEKHLELIGLNEVRYKRDTPNFFLSMWSLLPLPKPMKSVENTSRVIKTCSFEELGISLQLPESLGEENFVVRALQLRYDHFSDICPTWDPKPLLSEHKKDILQLSQDDWEVLCSLQNDVFDVEMKKLMQQRRTMIAQATALATAAGGIADKRSGSKASKRPAAPDLPKPLKGSGSKKVIDPAQCEQDYEILMNELQNLSSPKTTSQLFAEREDEMEAKMKIYLMYSCKPDELNLRKYIILGGVLHLDLLKQLPQPYELPSKFVITVLNVPRDLERVPFHVKYTPPPPPEPGQRRLPEEIEAELKKQEEQLEKLPLVNIGLPENVLWFEPPTVVIWNDTGYWSTADCHDFKFNEDKQILTFRLGRFGPLALAAYRYCNLPYQTWELKPDLKSKGVLLNITANIVIVEFTVKDDLVCLSQLQNGATAALQEIVGIYYKPHVLQRIMQRGGVDIFPDRDAYCYVEGSASKHRVAEDHLYHCMALFSTSHNFTWSRWNLLAGRRKMVLQMREYLDRKNLDNHSTLFSSPQRALLVDCTEVSQSFTEEGLPGMKFYADLFQLVEDNATPAAKKKYKNISFKVVETVFQLLKKTRVLSYS